MATATFATIASPLVIDGGENPTAVGIYIVVARTSYWSVTFSAIEIGHALRTQALPISNFLG